MAQRQSRDLNSVSIKETEKEEAFMFSSVTYGKRTKAVFLLSLLCDSTSALLLNYCDLSFERTCCYSGNILLTSEASTVLLILLSQNCRATKPLNMKSFLRRASFSNS